MVLPARRRNFHARQNNPPVDYRLRRWRTRRTCIGNHWPPFGAAMPRALRSVAIHGRARWRHLSAGTATSAYCCSMPASQITLVQRSVSSFLSCAMSAGLPPPGRRCSCRYRSLTSGSSSVALTARLSLAMMAADVFGGALMAFQVSERNPGTPGQVVEPTLGCDREDPGLSPGVELVGRGKFRDHASTCPPMRSLSAGPVPR